MRLVERVREAWSRGVSARTIAADLTRDGVATNRNAVIGIVHRHGFESPMSACNKPKRPAGTPRPRRARAKPVPVPPPKPDWRGEIALPASEGDAIKAFGKPCRLWELVDGCRWPLGDTREAAGVTFCNAVQIKGLPYCRDPWPPRLSGLCPSARVRRLYPGDRFPVAARFAADGRLDARGAGPLHDSARPKIRTSDARLPGSQTGIRAPRMRAQAKNNHATPANMTSEKNTP